MHCLFSLPHIDQYYRSLLSACRAYLLRYPRPHNHFGDSQIVTESPKSSPLDNSTIQQNGAPPSRILSLAQIVLEWRRVVDEW